MLFRSLTSLVAAHAMERALQNLKTNGVGQPEDLFDFNIFCSMIGFEDVWAFDRKWAKSE